MTHFGERLTRFRELKGLVLQDLAASSGISLGSLSKYAHLANASAISYGILQRLAQALELEVEQLTNANGAFTGVPIGQLASRESLKRFGDSANLPQAIRRKLDRVQEDPAAPKTVRQWQEFWRLVQRLGGQPKPTPQERGLSNGPGRVDRKVKPLAMAPLSATRTRGSAA